jgi:hypothetical protein
MSLRSAVHRKRLWCLSLISFHCWTEFPVARLDNLAYECDQNCEGDTAHQMIKWRWIG